MMPGDDPSRPSDLEVARAYRGIAQIYHAGGLERLARDYFELVAARFPDEHKTAARARAWSARCSIALGEAGAARRRLRSVVRDRRAPTALRVHAALRLARLLDPPALARSIAGWRVRLARDATRRVCAAVTRRWLVDPRRRDAG